MTESSVAETWRVRASAKINLTLRVLGIRADGYHELRTTFQSLAIHDTLTLVRRRGAFALTSDDPRCPCDASNLVWKAAAALWTASGKPRAVSGVCVHIAKRIPMEAGLGGGSSDAAAALVALRSLWRLRVPDTELAAIGRTLGADVPFFLDGGTALGVERGDLLFPLMDAPPAWVVIARPDFGVSTKDAYGWWDGEHLATAGATRSARAAHGPVGRLSLQSISNARNREMAVASEKKRVVLLPEAGNDLQGPVAARHPRITQLVRALERSGARQAAMSGSGSAVFGMFDARQTAETAASQLASSTVTTWVTRTTSRRQHLRASAPRRLR